VPGFKVHATDVPRKGKRLTGEWAKVVKLAGITSD
jgi:hypothetical protein